MEYRRFGNKIIARMDKGEEIIAQLMSICDTEGVHLGSVSAIGAVSHATLGCFDTAEKKYYANEHAGIFEISSLSGTVSTMDSKPYVHVHATIANKQNTTFGGHLSRAVVSATCEMVIDIIDGRADRTFSNEIGLNLFDFDK